ncbi:MAG: GNAT family N-acetyltransferase [Microbacteriaceae bacterium]|nr:GNAT family N-acetyltransferase [Microbacteriaceae bacterium]
MTELVAPDTERYAAWAACRREFGGLEELHGDGHWFLPEPLQRDLERDTFDALLALLRRYRRDSADGLIPTDFLWIVDGEELLGFIRISHRLEGRLLESGHIGYSIRPSRRREGHASRALALALAHARGLGIERALVVCQDGNIASERTILANGGSYEAARDGNKRFWFELD